MSVWLGLKYVIDLLLRSQVYPALGKLLYLSKPHFEHQKREQFLLGRCTVTEYVHNSRSQNWDSTKVTSRAG